MVIQYKKDIIYEHLKREILSGMLPRGGRLPKEVILSKQMNVGQVTLRSALKRLEDEGLIERIPSKGTFVSNSLSQNTFLIIIPDDAENFETPSRYIFSGIDQIAREKAITIESTPVSLIKNFTDREFQEIILRHNINGIIYETGHLKPDAEVISKINLTNLPAVIPHGLYNDAEETGLLVLRTNEHAAISQSLLYLKSKNHKRIGTIFLTIEKEDISIIRGFSKENYQDFLRLNELDYDDELIQYTPSLLENLEVIVRKWMFGPNPPTAILCHSDRVAMFLYQILKKINFRIPQEISIMGYCNYPGSQLLLPALTTTDIEYSECGKIAVQKLLEASKWYQKGITPLEIFTPFHLIERHSVANLSLNS